MWDLFDYCRIAWVAEVKISFVIVAMSSAFVLEIFSSIMSMSLVRDLRILRGKRNSKTKHSSNSKELSTGYEYSTT
jgi:hypothetical protein